MAETFSFKIRAEPSGQKTYRTLVAEFGDGYSQAAADGINNHLEVWNIEARGPWVPSGCATGQSVKAIADFLDARSGWESFGWITPSGKSIMVACEGYSTQKLGGGIVTISAVFKQVFR